VIVALRIRLLIFLLHGRYIPVDRSGQAPIQTFVFMTQILCLPCGRRIFACSILGVKLPCSAYRWESIAVNCAREE